ncbi:hypothetical protein TPE_0290 [Treponema pedis str. T A4]|uniref:Uncharacterized protein n=1 Tax=Treponema pedis str. T A4 TaxID=1291379 RepID=S6A2L6_9SPIR|nr:hypothetical protein TPE_0290 [Treponema pedis str. T A4]
MTKSIADIIILNMSILNTRDFFIKFSPLIIAMFIYVINF